MFSKNTLLFVDRSVINITISADAANYNLYNAAIATGWDGASPVDVTVTISSGVVVYATSTGSYAFRTGTGWPVSSTLKLINNGYIIGKGGAGGHGDPTLTSGSNGGPAFNAEYAITVTNNGTIGGGGGGGAGGNNGSITTGGQDNSVTESTGGGGGGGGRSGRSNSSGGGGGNADRDGGAGGSGTFSGGGGAGSGGGGSATAGGAGGNWGSTGGNDQGGGSNPGAGGAAVVNNANVTWLATGTRMGSIS